MKKTLIVTIITLIISIFLISFIFPYEKLKDGRMNVNKIWFDFSYEKKNYRLTWDEYSKEIILNFLDYGAEHQRGKTYPPRTEISRKKINECNLEECLMGDFQLEVDDTKERSGSIGFVIYKKKKITQSDTVLQSLILAFIIGLGHLIYTKNISNRFK